MPDGRGYSYAEFCAGIAERDGVECWVHRLLAGRRAALVEAWGKSAAVPGDAQRNWIPSNLLNCDGELDGHHVLSKSWLKREYPDRDFGGYWVAQIRALGEDVVQHRALADLLNDSRNGVCVCRRHHDLIERKLVVVRRTDLPPSVEEFAAELGDKAVARLEHDFGPVPVSPVELEAGR